MFVFCFVLFVVLFGGFNVIYLFGGGGWWWVSVCGLIVLICFAEIHSWE